MKKAYFTAVMLAVAAASTPAFGQNVVVSYGNMVSALSGYHGAPDAGYWNRLKPESARPALIKLTGDKTVPSVIRARALKALVYFANTEVEELLGVKADNDPIAYVRASAYEAIAAMTGARSVDALEKGLYDNDVTVRLAVTRVLGGIKTAEAVEALHRGLAREKNSTARSLMSNTLKRTAR